jgi:hypothetical protein
MDFTLPIEDQAKALLIKLKRVGEWAKTGDPRAKPYLDAGAVKLVDGEACFHRNQFIEVFTQELVAERLAPVDRLIAAARRAAQDLDEEIL